MVQPYLNIHTTHCTQGSLPSVGDSPIVTPNFWCRFID